MSILTWVRERFQRRYGFSEHYAPESGPGVFRGQDAPTQTLPSPVPAAPYEPHGIDTEGTLAEIVARAQADAEAAHEAAVTGQWGTWDEPGTPLAPPAEIPPAPPIPPSGLSRAMVSQIPSPPPNDRNFDWTHKYADYMRRVGVATGTSTDLEHTTTWGVPALEPGDGTGERL